MKKITRTLLAALAVASMAACTQEIEGPVNPSALALDEFGASAEASTKVTIADWKLSWEAGDLVDIHDGTAKTVFAAAAAGESTVLKADDKDFAREAGKTYYAVYPSSDANAFDGTSVTLTVAGDRTAVVGEYPAAPAVGVTAGEDASFIFRNVCGLVSFEIAADQNITSVVIFGGNGENIAGTVEVNAADATYELAEGAGVKEIRLTPADGDVFAAGRYYVAVLPQEFQNGLSVTLYKNDGTRLRKNLKAFTLGRSSHVDVETGGTFKTEFTIKNADELVSFLEVADKCAAGTVATLANDIDLSGVTLPAVSTFAGTFDGASHSLKNWTTDEPLFTKIVAGATVKNLILDASCTLNLKETDSRQAFVVAENAGTVSGCTNKADITYTRATDTPMQSRLFGTIVGFSTGLVSDCHNEGNITITIPILDYDGADGLTYQHQRVGGVVGGFAVASGTTGVTGCTNEGNITYNFNGVSDNTLRPFFAIGGVCAVIANNATPKKSSEAVNNGTIADCTNSGEVKLYQEKISGSNYSNVGGVVGYLEGTISGCVNGAAGKVTLQLKNESSTTKVSAPAVGGVVGNALTGDVLNCSNAASVYMTGYIQGGTADATYAGGSHIPAIGGVVAKAGTTTENTALKIQDCKNAGKVSAKVWNNSNICMGGVVGWTSVPMNGSGANTLENRGAVTVEEGSVLSKIYAGGVVGYSSSVFDKVYNAEAGAIDVHVDAEQDNEVWVGGIAGYMAKTICTLSEAGHTETETFKQGINKGNITLSGGNASGTHTIYVAGVVAESKTAKVTSNGTSWATCNSNYGNITVDSPARLCVGGVIGKINAATGSGHSGQTQRCKHQGVITVNSPGSGSYIGGVIGAHGRGTLGNANGFGESDSKPGKIVVTGADASTYVGGYVGYLYTDNGAGTTISGCGFRGEMSVEGATAGVIAGFVGMSGKSCKNVIKLGSAHSDTQSERPKVSKSFKLNGVAVGNFESDDILESHYFGKISPSTTTGNAVAGQYFFQAAGIEGNLSSFKEGLLQL